MKLNIINSFIFLLLISACNADSSETEGLVNEATFAGHVVQTVYSIQYWRDLCTKLSPESQARYSDIYENSSLPKFHEYLPQSINPMSADIESMSNDQILNSIRQTQDEAKQWCERDYVESIKSFDKDSDQALSRIRQYIKDYEKSIGRADK